MVETTLAVASSKVVLVEWTREYIELVKRMLCPDATDVELELLAAVGRRTGLDAFRRQLILTRRWDSFAECNRPVILTSIDGFRSLAQRTGEYAGQLGPFWCGPDGNWKDVWLDAAHPPVASKVAVLRKGWEHPLWGVARYRAYVGITKQGTVSNNWVKMPDVMTAKCAEALAIRRGFPDDTGGLYTEDEMQQALNPPDPPTPPPSPAARALRAAPAIPPSPHVDPPPSQVPPLVPPPAPPDAPPMAPVIAPAPKRGPPTLLERRAKAMDLFGSLGIELVQLETWVGQAQTPPIPFVRVDQWDHARCNQLRELLMAIKQNPALLVTTFPLEKPAHA